MKRICPQCGYFFLHWRFNPETANCPMCQHVGSLPLAEATPEALALSVQFIIDALLDEEIRNS